MGKKLKTVVAFVLDESGSMNDTADDTRGAVNAYFETLAQEAPDALVTLVSFSTDGYGFSGTEKAFRTLVSGAKATTVPKLTDSNYRPRGNTPLYDAIGRTIAEVETVKADRYLLVVMTDGQENSSREYSLNAVKRLIEKKQGENWTIVYLGANQDAWAVGTSLGVAGTNTMSYAQTNRGVAVASSSLSTATATYLASDSESTDTVFADAGQTAADYEDPSDTV